MRSMFDRLGQASVLAGSAASQAAERRLDKDKQMPSAEFLQGSKGRGDKDRKIVLLLEPDSRPIVNGCYVR